DFALASDVDLRLALPIKITASRPLVALAAWRDAGAIEIEGGEIEAVDGAALAGFDAKLQPGPDGALSLSGELVTDCPATMAALVAGDVRPATEYRQRRPARFTIAGTLAAPQLIPIPGPTGGRARNREPPCPDLRR
ncbi:MAG: hypothetical protein AAGD40_12220, partial [Pseudomonadota bacterium]